MSSPLRTSSAPATTSDLLLKRASVSSLSSSGSSSNAYDPFSTSLSLSGSSTSSSTSDPVSPRLSTKPAMASTSIQSTVSALVGSSESDKDNSTTVLRKADRYFKYSGATVAMRYPQMLERLCRFPLENRVKSTVCIIGPSALIPGELLQLFRPDDNVTLDPQYESTILPIQVYEVSQCLPNSTTHLVDIDERVLSLIERSLNDKPPPYIVAYPYEAALKTLQYDFKDSNPLTKALFKKVVDEAGHRRFTYPPFNRSKFTYQVLDIGDGMPSIKKCDYVFATNVLNYPVKKAKTLQPERRLEALKTLCNNVFSIVKIGGKIYLDQRSVKKICKRVEIYDNEFEQKFLNFIQGVTVKKFKAVLLTNNPTNSDQFIHLPLASDPDSGFIVTANTDAIYEFTRQS